MVQAENPFVFGEVIDDLNFVNRTEELAQLVRDLADGQKVFLLSPRRFGQPGHQDCPQSLEFNVNATWPVRLPAFSAVCTLVIFPNVDEVTSVEGGA